MSKELNPTATPQPALEFDLEPTAAPVHHPTPSPANPATRLSQPGETMSHDSSQSATPQPLEPATAPAPTQAEQAEPEAQQQTTVDSVALERELEEVYRSLGLLPADVRAKRLLLESAIGHRLEGGAPTPDDLAEATKVLADLAHQCQTHGVAPTKVVVFWLRSGGELARPARLIGQVQAAQLEAQRPR